MPRDKEIKRAFEIADDGMQGIIGYFHYVKACKNVAEKSKIIEKLPYTINENTNKYIPAIQITHDWIRFYSPIELYNVMQDVFLYYHARVALISLISNFEGSLKNFIDILVKKNKIQKPKKDNYKTRLKWAFNIANQSTYGNNNMQKRIPDLCLNVDHARRIRNLWMHDNGLFNERYGQDIINIDGKESQIDPKYYHFLNDPKMPIPFILKPDVFDGFALSHIEILHHINDTIQRKYFGQQRSYSYKALRKKIEWQRLLIGI